MKSNTATLIEILETVQNDCRNALTDDWDRSDEGFEAIIDILDEALEIVRGING